MSQANDNETSSGDNTPLNIERTDGSSNTEGAATAMRPTSQLDAMNAGQQPHGVQETVFQVHPLQLAFMPALTAEERKEQPGVPVQFAEGARAALGLDPPYKNTTTPNLSLIHI